MPEFVYTAKNTQGQQVQGSITAAGTREAIAALSQQALFPMRVELAGKKSASVLADLIRGREPRVKSELVANALSQLADLLASGVPLLDGLDILASQATHPTLQKVLTQIHDDVADGTSLDEALARHPRVFPDLIISIVRAGSAGAFLEEALARTADFLVMQEEMKSRVKGAMAYPVFLAIIGSLVTIALVVFFVPKFAPLFTKLEQSSGLPWATVALLWLSDALWKYGIFLAIGSIVVIASCRRWMRTARGQVVMDDLRLRVPLMGTILQGFAVSRCCRVLGTLLRNGVPLLKSLAISADAAGNKSFSAAIRSAASNVSSGETLSEPLAASELFPPEIMAIVRVAEQSNNLDVVLLQIADRSEKRNIQKLDILVRLVEPVLLLLMGCAMLFVIVALLLPVFDMGTTVG